MRNRILFLLCFLVVGLQAFAQTSVSGKVVDATGFEMPGVNITVKGQTVGTMTGADGTFMLSDLSGGSNTVLVFSFIGYKTQEVKVGNQKFMNIIMTEDAEQLEEVVVVAYGTAKKKDLTGAMTQIDSKVIGVQNVSSASKVLEGTVPGVNLGSVDGQPGVDAGIRVRGVGSTNVNSSGALIVIDGVPAQTDNPLSNMNPQDIASMTVLKDAASTALYGSRGANGVVLITTKKGSTGKAKISFQGRWGVNTPGTYKNSQLSTAADHYEYVWKSIYNSYRYGVDGTGGPQKLTTNVNNPNVSHEAAAEFASQHLFNYIGSNTNFGRNVLGNYMAYDVPGAVYTPDGASSSHSSTMSGAYLIDPATGKISSNARLLYDDTYADALLSNSLRQDYNLTANGGSEKMDYFVSLGYLSDPSFIKTSDFQRYTGRSNVNAKLFDWLKVGANVAYTRTKTNYMGTLWGARNSGSNQGSVMRFVNGHSPIFSVYQRDKDGNILYGKDGAPLANVQYGETYSPLGETTRNYGGTDPFYQMDNDIRQNINNSLNMRTYAELSFLKYFKFTVNLSLDKVNNMETRYMNGYTGRAKSYNGAFGKLSSDYTILNTQEMLSYNQDFGKHHVDGMVLHEYNDWEYERVTFGSSDEFIPNFLSSSNFVGKYYTIGGMTTPGYAHDIERMESFLARGNYIYDDKYYASASFRMDGSSKFKNDRWGKFWSVGGGWRLSDEEFMEPTKEWLDNAKIRASYGLIGNQNAIGRYSGYRTWSYSTNYKSVTNGTGVPTGNDYKLSVGGLVNDQLTWENTKTVDVGLDLSLFNRLSLTFDFYNRLTDNSFFNQPVSYLAVGQHTVQQNIAQIRNRGFEIDLNVNLINTDDFRWNVALNGTHYTTKLVGLPESAVPTKTEGLPDGTWMANGESWTAAGGTGDVQPFYLRGVGKDWYNIYMYRYAGVDQETGLPLFYHSVTENDVTAGTYPGAKVGDDVKTKDHTQASRYEVGSAIPAWIGGFTTTFNYKGFDLTAILSYQLGGKFYSMEYGNGLYRGSDYQSFGMMLVSDELKGNTWTPENKNAKFPMQWYAMDDAWSYDGCSVSDSWDYTDIGLFSASYLRIKNITVGYTLPKQLLTKLHISNMRVYASGDNLALFSAHKGVDPSMSLSGGYDVGYYIYPNIRSFTFGINLDF